MTGKTTFIIAAAMCALVVSTTVLSNAEAPADEKKNSVKEKDIDYNINASAKLKQKINKLKGSLGFVGSSKEETDTSGYVTWDALRKRLGLEITLARKVAMKEESQKSLKKSKETSKKVSKNKTKKAGAGKKDTYSVVEFAGKKNGLNFHGLYKGEKSVNQLFKSKDKDFNFDAGRNQELDANYNYKRSKKSKFGAGLSMDYLRATNSGRFDLHGGDSGVKEGEESSGAKKSQSKIFYGSKKFHGSKYGSRYGSRYSADHSRSGHSGHSHSRSSHTGHSHSRSSHTGHSSGDEQSSSGSSYSGSGSYSSSSSYGGYGNTFRL